VKKLRQLQRAWVTMGKIESTKSRRGKYGRCENWRRLWIDVIRDRVTSLNLEGKPVTLKTIMVGSLLKYVMSESTLSRALHSMKFSYQRADKKQNFIESDYIRGCRKRYLEERRRIREKERDTIEVWLDESYYH